MPVHAQAEDPWGDYNGFMEQQQLEVGDNDMPVRDCDELSTQLWILGRKEAADYIDERAHLLCSFEDNIHLIDIFDWNETPQGYGFWEECYVELLSCGYEDANHEALKDG